MNPDEAGKWLELIVLAAMGFAIVLFMVMGTIWMFRRRR